eukprot:TRINITY_DN31039_c0_g1_i1.p1 TRINITY_DN31039_c0_g1~~TRINITY_DN31039_c0_g1_i1.p1  ORF type:complete len:278 (-),score=46.44 TRINITY_DN31039_c0_g1_i1:149-982(-)
MALHQARPASRSLLVALATAGSLALWWSSSPTSFVSPAVSWSPSAGLSAARGIHEAQNLESLVPRGDQFNGKPWKGGAQFKDYSSFSYRLRKRPGMRLRMHRFGRSLSPSYRIVATKQGKQDPQTSRIAEQVGYFNPLKEMDDPKMFGIKADRAVFWMRHNIQITESVANLLDIVGIIRRTGSNPRGGDWEWRIDKNSGPEEPEGWNWDGPQVVSWNNKPRRMRKHNPRRDVSKVPLIERFSFVGYDKIPIDDEIIKAPATRDKIFEAFPNTNLPMY